MAIDFLDKNGNIVTPEGDTFTLEFKLTKESPWKEQDKVLVEIRRKNLGESVYQKLLDLSIDNEDKNTAYAYFRMASSDAKNMDAGSYIWSYTVYLNCVRLGTGEYIGDEEITPFSGSRKYEVKEVASNGRD
jgi:hypothetical protein